MNADDAYFDFLCESVGVIPDSDHYEFCEHAHDVFFDVSVGNDLDRTIDAVDTRTSWFSSGAGSHLPMDKSTIFEMMVALSSRMEFIDGVKGMGYWFNVMIINLSTYTLTWTEAIYRFNLRQYNSDGIGGLFPLINPKEDQTKVEIWYQMHSWMGENN